MSFGAVLSTLLFNPASRRRRGAMCENSRHGFREWIANCVRRQSDIMGSYLEQDLSKRYSWFNSKELFIATEGQTENFKQLQKAHYLRGKSIMRRMRNHIVTLMLGFLCATLLLRPKSVRSAFRDIWCGKSCNTLRFSILSLHRKPFAGNSNLILIIKEWNHKKRSFFDCQLHLATRRRDGDKAQIDSQLWSHLIGFLSARTSLQSFNERLVRYSRWWLSHSTWTAQSLILMDQNIIAKWMQGFCALIEDEKANIEQSLFTMIKILISK